MARKQKRRRKGRGRHGGGQAPNRRRLGKMGVGCFVMVLVFAAFLIIPRLVAGT